MDKYYIPKFEEFKIGFKFQSKFWLFSQDGEWADSEITEDNIEDFKELYIGDAYETEFRAVK